MNTWNPNKDYEEDFLPVGFYHTTGVACKNLSRYFIGIELDEKYFEIAKDRIDNFIPDDFLN